MSVFKKNKILIFPLNEHICYKRGNIMIELNGVYYKNQTIDGDRTVFSFMVSENNTQYRGQRIVCSGMVPIYDKFVPLVLSGQFDNNIFEVQSSVHSKDNQLIKQYIKKSTGLTLRLAGKALELFGNEMIWNIDYKSKSMFVNHGFTDADADRLIILFTGVRNAERSYGILSEVGYMTEHIYKFLSLHKTVDDIAAHPYEIGYDCGVSLDVCDNTVRYFSNATGRMFNPNAQDRVGFIIKTAADRIASNGDTFVTLPELAWEIGKSKLKNDKADTDYMVLTALDNRIFTPVVKDNHMEIFLTQYLDLEKKAAEHLFRIQSAALPDLYENDIQFGQYDSKQKKAIIGSLGTSAVSIITGGPGTGKTTVTKEIVSYLENKGLKVFLCAPTGRASARMKESTGHSASTIHRLIGIHRVVSGGFDAAFNEQMPLDCDAIIVDETSMVSLDIFVNFLRAVKTGCRIIFLGDINQLPSVSAGDILHDLIDSGCFPVYHLTKVYRQKDGSGIIDNAYRILAGEKFRSNTEFEIRKFPNDHSMVRQIEITFKQYNDEKDPYAFQVLVPVKHGASGTFYLNKVLMDTIPGRSVMRTSYAKNDKVMAIRNNYDSVFHYMNGDVGLVHEVYDDMIEIDLCDGNHIYLRDLTDLQHAYAVTIHKSQGSEYDTVLIALGDDSRGMLNRNLLYTALTRARKKVILYYTEKVASCKVSQKIPKRNSGLKDKLVSLFHS